MLDLTLQPPSGPDLLNRRRQSLTVLTVTSMSQRPTSLNSMIKHQQGLTFGTKSDTPMPVTVMQPLASPTTVDLLPRPSLLASWIRSRHGALTTVEQEMQPCFLAMEKVENGIG